MYQERPFGLFRKYAIPQMIGLLLNSAYLIVDGIFIGNRLGRDALAAAAVSKPVIEFLIAVSFAVSVGAGVLISSSFGSGDTRKANQVFNLSLGLALFIAVLVAVLGNVFIRPLAAAFGATPEIMEPAVVYLRYILFGAPFLIFSFAFSTYARADNRPTLAMVSLVVGSVSNIILDYVFLYPLDMGIAGAALATALGPVFTVLILLPHFLAKKGLLHFTIPEMSWRRLWAIIYLGIPAFAMEFSIGTVTLFYNIAIVRNGFGEIGLAAYLVIGYLALIVLTIFLGLAQGIQPVISYFTGRGDKRRSRELMAFLLKAVTGIGLGMTILILLFSGYFFAIFTPTDTELIAFSGEKAAVYFSGFVFAGISILIISCFQAKKRAMTALFLAMMRSVILVPVFLWVFPKAFGAQAIWPALSVAELMTGVLSYVLYRKSVRSDESVLPESGAGVPA